jgi:hypothetical protein
MNTSPLTRLVQKLLFIALTIAVITLVAIGATVTCCGHHPCNRRSCDRRSCDRRSCDRHPRNRRVSSLQKRGWLLRTPSHRSFSVVASCDRWGGKIRLSSSLLISIGSASRRSGSRPEHKKLNFIVACGLCIAHVPCPSHAFAIFYPPGVCHVAIVASVPRWSSHLKFDCCMVALVSSQSTQALRRKSCTALAPSMLRVR